MQKVLRIHFADIQESGLMSRMSVSTRLYLVEVFKLQQNQSSCCFILVLVLNLWAVVIFDQKNSSADSKQEKDSQKEIIDWPQQINQKT